MLQSLACVAHNRCIIPGSKEVVSLANTVTAFPGQLACHELATLEHAAIHRGDIVFFLCRHDPCPDRCMG